jgi:hypothetical protein
MELPNYCFWDGSKAKKTTVMLSAITEDQELGTVSFTIASDDPTGVENLTPTLSEGEGVCYDLQGRKVSRPSRGIYIVNGRKVVIR